MYRVSTGVIGTYYRRESRDVFITQSKKESRLSMPSVLQLDRCCWNYHLQVSDYEGLPPMAKELTHVHIHLASVEYFDVVAIATIQSNFNGLWDLLTTNPRANESSASELLSQLKSNIRASYRQEFKSGLLVPVHNCSPRRVQNSFEHIMFNQGVVLYDPERDGVPQF